MQFEFVKLTLSPIQNVFILPKFVTVFWMLKQSCYTKLVSDYS